MSEELDEEIWAKVEGIDFDGPATLASLGDLASIEMTAGERNEILLNLCRDGWVSSAGYPALPRLLAGHPTDAKISLEMAWTAGMILSLAKNEVRCPSPDLDHFISEDMIGSAIRRILSLAAKNDLDAGELMASFAWVMDLKGRPDLSRSLWELLNHEASGRSVLSESEPDGLRWSSSLNTPSFLNGYDITSSKET